MAILEKEILVTLTSGNIKHYETLGYEIPRKENKYGQITIAKGTEISVKVEHLPPGSVSRITKVCDDCGKHTPNLTMNSLMNNRNSIDNKDRCANCAQKHRNQKNKIEYKNSLEYMAKINDQDYLLLEYSKKMLKGQTK